MFGWFRKNTIPSSKPQPVKSVEEEVCALIMDDMALNPNDWKKLDEPKVEHRRVWVNQRNHIRITKTLKRDYQMYDTHARYTSLGATFDVDGHSVPPDWGKAFEHAFKYRHFNTIRDKLSPPPTPGTLGYLTAPF